MSLRIKEQTVKGLEKESTREGISLNSLANMVFDEYLDVHLPALKSGLVYTPEKLLHELLRDVPDEKIPTLADIAAYPRLESFTCMKHTGFESNSMLQTLLALAKYSGYTCVENIIEDGERTVSLVHRMGIKYSKLIQVCLECASADTKDSAVHFEISDSRVSMSVKHKA